MKFKVGIIEATAVHGGSALALMDERGNVLPNQINTIVETGVGDVATAVVTFLIDGKDLCLSQ